MMRGICQLKFQGSQCQFDIPLHYRQLCTLEDPVPSDCTGLHEAEVQTGPVGVWTKTIVSTDAIVRLLGNGSKTNYSGPGYIDIPDIPFREYFVMWSFARCQAGNLAFSLRYASPYETSAVLIVNGEPLNETATLKQTDSFASFRSLQFNVSIDFPSALTVKVIVSGGIKAPNFDYLQVSFPGMLPE